MLDELRETGRPSSFTAAAEALADAVVALADEDAAGAVRAARAAKRLAPRSAAVREALGLAQYASGDYRAARAELAAAMRFSARDDLMAVLADTERALGRPDRALELFDQTDRRRLPRDVATELLVVAASAYGDLGQPRSGAALLRRFHRWPEQVQEHDLRAGYAEGDLAERAGDAGAARRAFGRVAEAAPGYLDVAARLEAL